MTGTQISAVNGTNAASGRRVENNKYILFDINDTAHVWFSSAGSGEDIWYMNSYNDYTMIYDPIEPSLWQLLLWQEVLTRLEIHL